MSRDTYDMFNCNKDRGRFGDNESTSVRGNDSVRSDLVDLTLTWRDERPLAIAVTDPAKAHSPSKDGRKRPEGKWIWLPKSKIEFERKGLTAVAVSLPIWLAREKGFL